MNLQLAFAILSLVLKYGAPAVQSVLETWSKSHDDITVEDIEALKELIKHPDEYLGTTESTETTE